MYARFESLAQPQSSDKVLDVGVTPDISLPDSNFFEMFYPYPENLTAVSIEDVECLRSVFPRVTFKQVQPGPLPYLDKEFDILFCSAVLEHVGSRDNQRAFLAELARVSKRMFITTPNRWHPIEFHTILPLIHWLPQGIHQTILKFLGYHFLSKTENLNLCGAGDLNGILPASGSYTIGFERFIGFPSNLIVYGEN
ncbi:Ubiquinone biosynthesis O-methyltransferase [Thalassocella blandensis]|nr:Ubiquinone biosynthesis O-methyltransferase [Thalassocella blandensis]